MKCSCLVPVVVEGKWPHRLKESGSIKRCGLAGVRVTLLEVVCH